MHRDEYLLYKLRQFRVDNKPIRLIKMKKSMHLEEAMRWIEVKWNERIELQTRWKINDTSFYVNSISLVGVWLQPLQIVIRFGNNRWQIASCAHWLFDCTTMYGRVCEGVCARVCRGRNHFPFTKLHYLILFIQWQIRFLPHVNRFAWAHLFTATETLVQRSERARSKNDGNIDWWPYICVMYLLPLWLKSIVLLFYSPNATVWNVRCSRVYCYLSVTMSRLSFTVPIYRRDSRRSSCYQKPAGAKSMEDLF